MDPVSVTVRLREVRERAAAAARRAGRSPSEAVLVAIGKGHPARTLEEARAAGQTVFGESRGQELVSKYGVMSPDVEWHFVGPLQTNKVRMVRPRVALLHSFDRDRLVRPWLKGEPPAPPALLQVNIGMAPQKQGVPPRSGDRDVRAMDLVGCRGERADGHPSHGRRPGGESALFRPHAPAQG